MHDEGMEKKSEIQREKGVNERGETGKRDRDRERGREKTWSATTTAFHEMSFPSRRSSIKRRAASTVTDIDRVGRRCRRPR